MNLKKSIISASIISLIVSCIIGYKIIQHTDYVKGIALGIVFMGAFAFWMELIYFTSNKKYKSKKQKRIMCGVISALVTIYTIPLVFANILWGLEWLSFPIQIIFLIIGSIGFLVTFIIFGIGTFKD